MTRSAPTGACLEALPTVGMDPAYSGAGGGGVEPGCPPETSAVCQMGTVSVVHPIRIHLLGTCGGWWGEGVRLRPAQQHCPLSSPRPCVRYSCQSCLENRKMGTERPRHWPRSHSYGVAPWGQGRLLHPTTLLTFVLLKYTESDESS